MGAPLRSSSERRWWYPQLLVHEYLWLHNIYSNVVCKLWVCMTSEKWLPWSFWPWSEGSSHNPSNVLDFYFIFVIFFQWFEHGWMGVWMIIMLLILIIWSLETCSCNVVVSRKRFSFLHWLISISFQMKWWKPKQRNIVGMKNNGFD